MAKASLARMDIESLMRLQEQIEKTLQGHRAKLESQLDRLGGGTPTPGHRRGAMKGRKVPPKYRSRSGETWAGRGARPLWLVAELKSGKKLEEFLIDKTAQKRKRRAKR